MPESNDQYLDEERNYPSRSGLEGRLLDYLIHLARKNLLGQDPTQLAKFDPELSASFFECVRAHPERARFPSDEVYYYIIAIYSDEIVDVLGYDFLLVENENGFNDRLVKFYAKEESQFYRENPQLLVYKKEGQKVESRAERLSEEWEEKMQERTIIPALDLTDLL